MSRPTTPGKALANQVNTRDFQTALVMFWTQRCRELLQERNNLNEDDVAYVAERIVKLKDQRLQECVGSLIGWGTEDRAELETFCAIALEVMKSASPSRLRDAALKVELRFHMRDLANAPTPAEPAAPDA